MLEAPGVQQRARTRSGRAVRVLLVDDSSADRIRFGRALVKAATTCRTSRTARRRGSASRSRSSTSSVSDRQMPGTDGIELCRLVRGHPDTWRIL
jgi:PleD family two-component response regulator